ncbi:MAG: DUF5333 family protein [Sulfitobacter sp.]
MRGVASLLVGAVMLGACSQAPGSLSDNPERITPVDYFILRASQAGTAEILANRCPRYRFDAAKEQRLKSDVIARVEGDGSLTATADFMRQLVPKAQAETERYALEYQTRNNITASSTAEEYCAVAEREVAQQSIIGQLLKRK